MKKHISNCHIVMIFVLAVGFSHCASATSGEFEQACLEGALARVEFHVVDDLGKPVYNAGVNVFFDMLDRSKGRRVIGNTDTNGVFAAEAKTGGILEVEVTGEHHYRSTRRLCFIAMGSEHEVVDGKWQPWGAKENVALLPIKNPVARRTSSGWKRTHELNKWIGFDCEMYDFVSPFGSGKKTDMEVLFDWDGAWRVKDYSGMALKIRFPQRFAGGYYADKTLGSDYVGVYGADSNGTYQTEFVYSERASGRDSRGRVTSWERRVFDPSKVLVVRSRCKLNEDGTLNSSNYFQLWNIRFSGDERGAALKFLSVFNPTPNDTNLEPRQ